MECEALATQLNQAASTIELNSRISQIEESLNSLNKSRNHLLRATELRRREIAEIASLSATLFEGGSGLVK